MIVFQNLFFFAHIKKRFFDITILTYYLKSEGLDFCHSLNLHIPVIRCIIKENRRFKEGEFFEKKGENNEN